MAQRELRNNNLKHILREKVENVLVAQTGNTDLIDLDVSNLDRIWAQVRVTGQALDAFVVQGLLHPDGTYITLASTAAHYTSPAGIIYGASGDLTALAADATGWVAVDVKGLSRLKFLASSGSAAGSGVQIYVAGR